MSLTVTRRDCARLAGGGALGLLLSPVPWKLLDDTAIWSQNMPWVPTPRRGPVSSRSAICPLCATGCSLVARCVDGVPVALAGAAGTGGACPIGLAAHHMPYHPARLQQPARLERTASGVVARSIGRGEAVAALATALARARGRGERALVIDARPGRTISLLYRQALGTFPGGAVLTPPGAEGLEVPPELTGGAPLAVAVDLERTATLASFGAPVLDGWAAPGVVERCRTRDGRPLRILQIETRPSRTALAADRWLAIRPGSEHAVALGMVNVLLADGAVDASAHADLDLLAAVAGRFTPAVVAALSGIPPAHLITATRTLIADGPAAAIPGVDPGGGPLPPAAVAAVWALNQALGALGPAGALVQRRDVPLPEPAGTLAPIVRLAEIAPHSVGVVILDAAPLETVLPWPAVEHMLAEGATVLSLSPFLAGLARHADWAIPAPAPFEEAAEALGVDGAARTRWAVAPPLLPAPAGATPPALVLSELAAAAGLGAPLGGGDLEAALRARCAAVASRATGAVRAPGEGRDTSIGELASADALWAALIGGGQWLGEPGAGVPPLRLRPPVEGDDRLAPAARDVGTASSDVAVMPYGWKVAAADEALPPTLSKLYSESALRPAAPQAAVSPTTARSCGVAHGRRARLSSTGGSIEVEVVVDQAVMPGVVHLATGPDAACLGARSHPGASPVDVCAAAGSDTWRVAGATLTEA